MMVKKVLVIDDSAFNRRTITDMLEKAVDIEVVGTAVNGEEGFKKALILKPDIITVDLEMPVMDGFTFLRLLMVKMPTPVIVVSSRDDDANVFKALELGAVDFLAKPSDRISRDLLNIEKDIVSKVRMVSELKMDNLTKRVNITKGSIEGDKKKELHVASGTQGTFEVLAIGASTGGPPALQSIITALPESFSLPVVISQHMPPGFTRAFADRINRLSHFQVKEAENGDRLEKGFVFVAPGGKHLILKEGIDGVVVDIVERESDDLYAPSVDKMFTSVAEHYAERAIGVVLTGMGSDGKNGVIDIKESGGFIIAESEETSIVYGMPKEAVKTGKVDRVSPLNRIPEDIVELCGNVK